MRPLLCMISDGHAAPDLPARVRAAAHAGATLVQLRERHLEGAALVALARACRAALEGTGARLLINDRVDVALAAGAAGVHLRSDSFPAPAVRRVAPPGFLVGRSVHSLGEATDAAADGAVDYLLFGTVFPTTSKPGRDAAGLAVLSAVVTAVSVPVLAVGGMTAAHLPAVVAAGAAGAAGISMFADIQG